MSSFEHCGLPCREAARLTEIVKTRFSNSSSAVKYSLPRHERSR